MFKPLIKKVREESTNASILAENQSDEVNGHSTKEQQQHDNSDPSSVYRHRRSHSNAPSLTTNQSRASSISLEENKEEEEEIVKTLSTLFSSYVDEPVTTRNYLRIFKSWITTKEQHLEQRDQEIDKLTQQSNEVQDELSLLRNQITSLQTSRDKTPTNTIYLQKQLDRLRSDNESLKSTNKSLQSQLNDVQAERDDLLITSTDVSHLKTQEDLQRLKGENQQQHVEIERLRELLIERDRIIEEQDRRLLLDHETQSTQTDEENSFVESLAEPNVDTISKLQAELDDKNRTIKILQQRYNDLRKTLQREFHASIPKDLNQIGSTKSSTTTANPQPSSPTTLPLIHYDTPVTSQSDVDAAKRTSTARQNNAVRKNVTFTTTPTVVAAATGPAVTASAAILPHTTVESSSTKNQKITPRSSVDGPATLTTTNFKYLKHVLLKFMTSTEEEAIHLIRAVSTLLNFSSDEERLLRETLDYKMSWFGKVSRLKPLPS